MSKENKLNWLTLIVFSFIVLCLGYLVAIQLNRSLNSQYGGLKCIYNCQGFEQTIKSLK